MGRVKESGKTLTEFGIKISDIALLVNLIEENIITGKIAKKVADDMVASPGKCPKTIVEENPDYKPMTDSSLIETLVDKVLSENPDSIVDFKNGRDKAFQHLVGQVMKKCQGKAPPELVRDLLLKKLS